jgi:hypothetical protein
VKTTAVLMPSGITDEWRARARSYVTAWYARHFGDCPLVVGECAQASEWSKGEAIADAFERAGSPDVLVLADADSFTLDPDSLRTAIELVTLGGRPYVIPHRQVYRLRQDETERLHRDPEARPRLGYTARPVYEGPAGGGITVVSRDAFELVGGIDRRFLGWGGEDVAFGWALATLVGEGVRLEGRLVHLWHPHPAPNLRGSEASEELVAKYREARGVPRRMTKVIAGEPWLPVDPLPEPIRFRMTANRNVLRLPSGATVRFRDKLYETSDPDEVEQIRTFNIVREERRR